MPKRAATVRTIDCRTRGANDFMVEIEDVAADAAYMAESEVTVVAEITEGTFVDDPALRRMYKFLEMGGECFSIDAIEGASGGRAVRLRLRREGRTD